MSYARSNFVSIHESFLLQFNHLLINQTASFINDNSTQPFSFLFQPEAVARQGKSDSIERPSVLETLDRSLNFYSLN
jgi:hypothetical protein